jgi:acetyl-CoA carboxylase carboxyltransferase component
MTRSQDEKREDFHRRSAESVSGGGSAAVEKRKASGKMLARERIDVLLDPNSFFEYDAFVATPPVKGLGKVTGDGVVTGFGSINGRQVFVFAQDFTVMGGSFGERHAHKIWKVVENATRIGAPIIGLFDSGGARIQEGVLSLAGVAGLFYRNVMASGVVPQIASIMGPCAGAAVYSPALMDFVIMLKGQSHMFLTGPDVIKEVLNEEVTFEDLGGAGVHASMSGVAHFSADNEDESLAMIRTLLGFLPQNNLEDPPIIETGDEPHRADALLDSIIPDDPAKPYDMKEVILSVADNGEFLEVHPHFAMNIVVGFARLAGRSVGIVANQPRVLAGCLDINSSDKAARFVRFCNAFNIPLVTFVDVPGFLPGKGQELGGIIRHGAKLLFAYSEATVPKLTVITRKAYGGAYCVMSSHELGSDFNIAWPSAEIAVMGSRGAVNILYKKELASSKDPEKRRTELIAEYDSEFSNPYQAAEHGLIEAVIEPRQTRGKLIRALLALESKRQSLPPKKAGNIPL